MDLAASVLHYALFVFDGSKAYCSKDGNILLFRPRKHVERLNISCERLCIPQLDVEMVLASFDALIRVDHAWVTSTPGRSLYLWPFVFASEAFLGVRPSKSYSYCLIMSPVGPYYAEGINPVKILATGEYVRAVPGGTGAAKTAANDAASLHGAEIAKKAGYTPVLWLDGVHCKYLADVGTMNIMAKIGDEIVTHPLNGAIPAGVTRDSILTPMRDWGLKVSERELSIDEVLATAGDGTLKEMWGTGTAAVVSPVGELSYKGQKIVINGGRIGALTQCLYYAIVDIQYGIATDLHGWTKVVPV